MKRIHFLTFSRSDYASLRPVAVAAQTDPSFEVKVVAGGSHLLRRFGSTIEGIWQDGFEHVETIDFLREDDSTDAEIAVAYGRAVCKLIESLTNDRPDTVFIVGDRWEMLAAATAASLLRIPIAHHSGGDITQGSADNQTRYVLTTLSHLHFVALEQHRDRLIAVGEEPWRVAVVGEPALTQLPLRATRNRLSSELGLEPGRSFVVATFHPTTYDSATPLEQVEAFVTALEAIPHMILLTAPNPDAGSGAMYRRLIEFARDCARVRLVETLGPELYYGAMEHAEFMIGNSSSALWEAPSFALPAVNIGSRQKGRTRGANVIDAELDQASIQAAIAEVSDPRFRASLDSSDNPYLRSDTVESILGGLKSAPSSERLLAKVFVDPVATVKS